MKKRHLLFIVVLIILIGVAFSYFKNISYEKGFEAEILVKNLDTPWSIDFLPNENMIFTERGGKISVFDGKETKVIAEINVNEESESGLLGIAVDPDFNANSFIYVYYTYENGNKVSRFILKNSMLENESVLLDNIPNAIFHDGGRIKFGLDKKLYITTGDATIPSSARDINSLAGKILRMNPDGSVPEDNSFKNYVYSYGHRNPQGLAWHPESKELYSSEHGPTRNDEINIIKKGVNYGWPEECAVQGNYESPIRCYTEFTLAPSGIAFYGGDLYIAGLRGAQLRRIILNDDFKSVKYEEELFNDFGRIRDAVSHNGYIYIATSNKDGRGIPKFEDDKIIRIRKI